MAKALRALPDAPQALQATEVLAHLGVSPSEGLADEEVRQRLKSLVPTRSCQPAKPAD